MKERLIADRDDTPFEDWYYGITSLDLSDVVLSLNGVDKDDAELTTWQK